MPRHCWFLAACSILWLAPARGDDGLPLFDGKDLDGWVAEGVKEFTGPDGRVQPVWSVRDGLLVCDGRGFGFLRYDRREFADFVFHVEFRMSPKCNSGLGVRTRAGRDAVTVIFPSENMACILMF